MLRYRGVPVLTSEAAVRRDGNVTVEIGPPEIVAARDDSPDEGTFVGPRLNCLGGNIYLNWSFDWDVVDADQPDRPNGRVSRDGGRTWAKQRALMPPGVKYQVGGREVMAFHGNGFEVPGEPGVYRVPAWRSRDLGETWSGQDWVTVRYPGTKGLDIYYDPPAEYLARDDNYLRGGVKASPPARLVPFFRAVSPRRGPSLNPKATDSDGTIYSLVYARYLRDTSGIGDWEREFWARLNWQRYAVLMQVSRDRGCTWEFAGVPANGSDYEPRLDVAPGGNSRREDAFIVRPDNEIGPGFKGRVDFAPGDGFSEPSLAVFPDGEMLCALRTGGGKPLYCVRSYDRGRTWTRAEPLSPRYINPISGVNPKLVLLENGILALGTGRPDCTLHFSRDRGHTWFLSETLFATTSIRWDEVFSGSHTNISMVAAGGNALLYVHDATRPDPDAPNDWLKRAGHGLIIARRVEVHA